MDADHKQMKRPFVKVQDPVQTAIGFRLDASNGSVLAERAQILGISAQELAREYVVRALEEDTVIWPVRRRAVAWPQRRSEFRRGAHSASAQGKPIA